MVTTLFPQGVLVTKGVAALAKKRVGRGSYDAGETTSFELKVGIEPTTC